MLQMFKNTYLLLIVTACLILANPAVMAADNIIKETQNNNVFKGFLLNIWSRFKTFNPHNKQIAKAATVYTAGIRGAESIGTLVRPYWKGDLTQDADFQNELKLYGEASAYLDNGDLKQANTSLSLFLDTYPKSSLKPNALFAQGISYAASGNNDRASASLNAFVKNYASHPLAPDAVSLLKQLSD